MMVEPEQQTAKGREKWKRSSWLNRIRLSRKQDVDASSVSVVPHEQKSPPRETYKGLPIPEPCDELEIRLVHLQPRAVEGDKIKCKLTTQNLIGNSYEALSYEWGPVLPELLINMDGVEIPVRENLWWALHHLQLDDEPRVLWIDALCINQNNTEDRFSITCSAPFRLSQAAIDKDERRFPLALPLADLTLKFKGSECEDPRDAVFGLLGLTLLCCRDAVRADYLMTSEQLCNNLLLHHIAYHLVLEDTFIDSARTADIRDVCFAVTSTSRVTRELEHSIASLSMKARRSVWPIPAYSRTDRGRVILSLCANDLRNALRAPEAIEYRRYMSGTTSPAPTPPPNDAPVVDLRKTVTERLMGRAESWIAEHYRETADWEKQRESLATAKKVASRRPTHIFLTDTGYSGITTADTKIGDAAFSKGQFDLKVSVEGNHPQNNNPLKASNSQSGICVDAETTFQELLSWLK
ncbi:MAG: hypothetical protein CL912_11935 [Deltaproteobacteria bacterium]|mgnify:CR=1 FL=1|nr:hypothetical protein [Deltaproteobacteria bacterium]|tara:strand:- start:117 stop:1514 length:1398 start_codon:yes stop_codon:yes gene_type:complete